ncbi:hypothetical protein A3D81_02440 [Candidatus Curtissbacteria bacterium RIFCSPHIGHO2_02_FULL_40_17]|uniref:EamA domain-containing protein n=2 Tax=Candidatus Curtissiibacteriota TaxID=1752717 RepID=A0A1F5GJJ5_9BACT|nr:MAG: hypothetical protein A3D81_02440 [Candidatus Curtissbacteria bacterium RIFCSPHIGHO2_02_FULL_40_17]OGE07708.1 MAG: hypothetical protein A3I53_02685 [Candidatus Curtissbacteria bacterium RIFCSPLOWO2_02_FULL_40_13b]
MPVNKILQIGPPFIIIAALLWSLDGLLRRSLFVLPPALIVFWEHVLGAVILIPFVLFLGLKLGKMTKKEWLAIVFVSLFSGALGTIFYTAALGKVNYIQFSVVAMLQQLQPIWTITTAAIILKEKLTGNFLRWAALALIASYFVTFRDLKVNLESGSQTIVAAGFALAAGMMWGSSTAFSKVVLKQVSFITATFLRFMIAPIFALLFLVGSNKGSSLFAITLPQAFTLLVITLTTGMVALLIYYFGLKKTPARVSTILELVWPASAIFIDYVYFKKTLSTTQLLGVFVLLFAIYQVSKFKK